MRLIQITMGAGARTQITTAQIYSPFLTIQNNSANNVRVGDNTVSSTKGILLASGSPGGSYTIQRNDNRIPLFQYYISAPVGTIVDIHYE